MELPTVIAVTWDVIVVAAIIIGVVSAGVAWRVLDDLRKARDEDEWG